MDSSINLYDFSLHSKNWGLTYRLILEFNGLGYQTSTVLKSKKLEYQVEFFNAQMPCQMVPRWQNFEELEFTVVEYHLELEFVELKY